MSDRKNGVSRRKVLKGTAAGVIGAGLVTPTIFGRGIAAEYTNEPTGGTVKLGFNVPQTGP